MSEEKFEWTDDNVIDFHKKYMGSESHNIHNYLKQFKQSKLKDWEIVSYKTGDNIWYVRDYGKTWVIDTSNMDINSLKRLSDGEVFSVGDEDENHGKIKGFALHKEGTYLTVHFESGATTWIGYAKKKIKQPLFKTEDGVDILNPKERLYIVFSDFSCDFDCPADEVSKSIIKENYHKIFSTEQAAKDYIIMNKPCLSLKEINFWIEKEKYLDYPGGIAIHQLKQLVEKRINYK